MSEMTLTWSEWQDLLDLSNEQHTEAAAIVHDYVYDALKDASVIADIPDGTDEYYPNVAAAIAKVHQKDADTRACNRFEEVLRGLIYDEARERGIPIGPRGELDPSFTLQPR